MNILDLIKERYNTEFGGGIFDEMLAKASESKDEIVAVILTENALTRYHGPDTEHVIALRENNRLKGMFDLGAVLPSTNLSFILYIFTKDKVDSFTVGEFNGKVINQKIGQGQDFEWNTLYNDPFYAYLKKIEEWIDSSNDIKDDEFSKFNTVGNECFEDDFSPRRYSKNVYRIKAALEKEQTVSLSDVAEIIWPRPDHDRSKRAMHLISSEWKYPIDYTKLRENVLTSTPVQKDDILFANFDRMYLVDKEPDQELHISPNFYIIRPKGISPQYLFMYLQSETARIIMQSLTMRGVLHRIKRADMLRIPVVMPSLSDEEYMKTFCLRYYKPKDIADYSYSTQHLLAYYYMYKGLQIQSDKGRVKTDSLEDILEEEWTQNIRVCKTEVMKEFLDSDIRELNTCFRGKAYKATLILAGSILEAVLIDWLSEIKGIDYFNAPYIIRRERRDNDGNITYYEKEAVLADYIDEIKELARPRWMKSEEAHVIRKKRNLVHAKLCMRDTNEINEETCREVIQYLKEVIETRGIHSN